MISPFVMATRSASSTAKAGKEMMDRRPASISFEVEALGSMEHRMDYREIHKGVTTVIGWKHTLRIVRLSLVV